MKMLAVRNFFSTSHLYFFQQTQLGLFIFIYSFIVITFLIWYVFVFKFNCSLGNRYFWRCMLEQTKRQVHKWKFLQHALSRYVYNRSLCDIITQVEMAEE